MTTRESTSPWKTSEYDTACTALFLALRNLSCYIRIHHSVEEKTDYKFAYNAYGVGCTEVEIDVLTGELQILRVDILYDCGDR